MSGIHDDQPCQFYGCAGGDDLTPESPLHEQRQASAVVKMGMRQQNEIDLACVEAERSGVFLVEFAATLQHAAVNQNLLAGGLKQVAGAGDVAVGTVK